MIKVKEKSGHDTDYCFANNPEYPCHCGYDQIIIDLYDYSTVSSSSQSGSDFSTRS